MPTLRQKFILAANTNSGLGNTLSWSQSKLPYIISLRPLRQLYMFSNIRFLLKDFSQPTAFDLANGDLAPLLHNFPHLGTVASATKAFDRYIAPAELALSSRNSYWPFWNFVIAWALAKRATHLLWPMANNTLSAITWDAIRLGASVQQVTFLWSAIQFQHRRYQQPCPASQPHQLSRMRKALASLHGQPAALKIPISRDHLKRLLLAPKHDLIFLRNALTTIISTITCLHPVEAASVQVCDLLFDHDLPSGPQYHHTMALNLLRTKNDQFRKGHFPRIGKAHNPALDVITQLKSYLRRANLHISAKCTKLSKPGATCKACPYVFSKTSRNSPHQITGIKAYPKLIVQFVTRSLRHINIDTKRITGVSLRKGGISVATEAGVPDAILWMQTGHAQDRAARRYITLNSPTLLLDTWKAFRF